MCILRLHTAPDEMFSSASTFCSLKTLEIVCKGGGGRCRGFSSSCGTRRPWLPLPALPAALGSNWKMRRRRQGRRRRPRDLPRARRPRGPPRERPPLRRRRRPPRCYSETGMINGAICKKRYLAICSTVILDPAIPCRRLPPRRSSSCG